MLLFWLEQDQFEYEIRGLLMAFYPGVYIKQLQEEAPVGQEQFVVPEGKDNRPGPDLYLKVRYGQTQGRLELYAWEQ